MNLLELQNVSLHEYCPSVEQLQAWVDCVLSDPQQISEVVVRVVDEVESAELNQRYRHKTGPTNILSFPFEAPPGIESDLLGDLVLCAPVIEREALQQGKPIEHHWAHITIHGILHLIGYDHIDEHEAEEMEALEIRLLKTLNIANPYEEECKP